MMMLHYLVKESDRNVL